MKISRWLVALITALTLLGAPYQTSTPTKGKKSASTSQAPTSTPASGQIDINTASADELKSLPGIGDAYSAAIIKNRPYANKRQLVSRKVIPQATYDKISDRIIAKQTKGK
jgi:competence protein ComEA